MGLDDTAKVRLTEWFVQHVLRDLEDVAVPSGSKLDIASFLLTYQKVLRMRSTCELERTFTRFIRRKRANIAEMIAMEQLEVSKTQRALDLHSKIDAFWPFAQSTVDPNLPAERWPDIDEYYLADAGSEYDANSPELDVAKRFLFDGHEYPWLISRLRRECAMLCTGDTSSLVRRELTQALGNVGDLSLELHWDPVAFMNEQFGFGARRKLADIVCIVGNDLTPYAATCFEYLGLAWSRLGHTVLQFLDAWISEGAPENYGSAALRDFDVDCRVSLSNGWLTWRLNATAAELVVEVCEIVCFLSTTCRTSRTSTSGEPRMETCSTLR